MGHLLKIPSLDSVCNTIAVTPAEGVWVEAPYLARRGNWWHCLSELQLEDQVIAGKKGNSWLISPCCPQEPEMGIQGETAWITA